MKFINENELFLLEQIIKKNFASKYKDSILGIFWSVLKPLLIMITFTIIFSTLFKGSIENYATYFLAGKCIYDFFNGSISVSMNSIKTNQNILKKNATSKYIFVLGGICSEFLNFLISLVILLGVMIVTNAPFYFNTIPFAIIPIISIIMMNIGFGLMLSIICVYYTDIQHLWSVFSLILMYSVALFYPIEIIPEPFQNYMLLNPLFWCVDQFRDFFIYGSNPDMLNIINLILISTIILLLGIIVFKKYEKKTIMRL